MRRSDRNFTKIPGGKLGIIALEGCKALGEEIDKYIVKWRTETNSPFKDSIACDGYLRDTYLLDASCPRFGSGEAKGIIRESVRDMDLYIIADVLNHSITYSLCGMTNHMSPDDHYSDLKRIISAAAGKAKSINVIMPFLYESRQHKRSTRESLDCAVMLQELINIGVDNILTFDAHDPRVQNAIPICGFDNVKPTYQFVKALVQQCDDIHFDKDHLMVISPDEGAMQRAIYMGNVLGVDVGMFYKRRDYSKIIDGRNPIVAHEFLGDSLDGKDVLILDDMISSGESMIDVARQLKNRNARRVFCLSTFGLFTNGLDVFDKAVEEGVIEKVITTNLTYKTPELLERDWYESADVGKYTALLIDTLNHDASISDLLNPTERIEEFLAKTIHK
jgi:ribose-phosphate pyrophosphokinase